MISEETIQGPRSTRLGEYTYFLLGATTIQQLKAAHYVRDKDYGKYRLLKPDGLLLEQPGTTRVRVICVVELKTPSEFDTEQKRVLAAKQCNTYCRILDARFGIATDGHHYLWINPLVQEEHAETVYADNEVFARHPPIARGFSLIKASDGYPFAQKAYFDQITDPDEAAATLDVISSILSGIGATNSSLSSVRTVDPSALARSVWQDVWMAKSTSPVKALSTFVEIFIFKYLSDLGVLGRTSSGIDVSFDAVMQRGQDTSLRYYLDNVRNEIKSLFPESTVDHTTLINGMSLQGNAREDNHVFYNILKKFRVFGSLLQIDPQFKSRLFEDFLKKSTSVKNLGQFFTPRNVVKAMVRMSRFDTLAEGSKICDPACGVGGFILEPILASGVPEWSFVNGQLVSRHVYYGCEKGFEQDDKLTIVLAKANFLIYASDLLRLHPVSTEQFASALNAMFKVFDTTILGSLSELKPNTYDLIMSNPPYVTRGTAQIKQTIAEDAGLKAFYRTNAMGLEGLFMEKIVNELKPGGQALVVVPDGVLNRQVDDKLRKFILGQCNVDAIISLPVNTFYSTPKKTYILALTKRFAANSLPQTEPVFTYLIKSIGETLDARRAISSENDLPLMVSEYRRFVADKPSYVAPNDRCKVQPAERLREAPHWSVDRWWTRDEKVGLGMEEPLQVVTEDEFYAKLSEAADLMRTWSVRRPEDA